MSDTVIRVEGLGKKFKIGSQQPYHRFSEVVSGFGSQLAKAPARLFRKKPQAGDVAERSSNEFWALKDINFEVQQGDVVGIIGRNGAGKSTLLKILSRITEPTEGRFGLKGRVASLLEVGTGFHPELTGRENIFLSGSVLGMTRAEIKRKFDEIVDFAGVEQFLDTPVKRYSSGMQVRLGFAVAAHLEPEILIVDEVLAVGDAEFQKKCLGKMNDVAQSGRTILFVSHNMAAVRQLCQSGLLLERGEVKQYGQAAETIAVYLDSQTTVVEEAYESRVVLERYRDRRPDCDKMHFVEIMAVSAREQSGGLPVIPYGAPITIRFKLKTSRMMPSACINFLLTRSDGVIVLCASSTDVDSQYSLPPGEHTIECTITDSNISHGQYFIEAGANPSLEYGAFDHICDMPLFIVENSMFEDGRLGWASRPRGAITLVDQIRWSEAGDEYSESPREVSQAERVRS